MTIVFLYAWLYPKTYYDDHNDESPSSKYDYDTTKSEDQTLYRIILDKLMIEQHNRKRSPFYFTFMLASLQFTKKKQII